MHGPLLQRGAAKDSLWHRVLSALAPPTAGDIARGMVQKSGNGKIVMRHAFRNFKNQCNKVIPVQMPCTIPLAPCETGAYKIPSMYGSKQGDLHVICQVCATVRRYICDGVMSLGMCFSLQPLPSTQGMDCGSMAHGEAPRVAATSVPHGWILISLTDKAMPSIVPILGDVAQHS